MMKFKHYISCIDAHTAGEPLRIVTSGFPPIPGNTMLEKRDYVNKHYNGLRKMLMLEPRGHSGMYGCILVPAVTPDGDFGVLFTHNEGLSSMCGHGIIGVTKVAVESGMLNCAEGENVVKIDAPAGRITAFADVEGGCVRRVRFQNVPCFVYKENIPICIDSLGKSEICDIAYCGAFYVYIDAEKAGLQVRPEQTDQLVKIGMEIKNKMMGEHTFKHPQQPGIDWLYGTILTSPVSREGNMLVSSNVCIFADGQVDRSPTGTGTGGRTALLVRKGVMTGDDVLVNKSVIGTVMESRVVSSCKVGEYDAVITEVSGTAHIMGFNNIVLDPEDPLPEGFRIIGS